MKKKNKKQKYCPFCFPSDYLIFYDGRRTLGLVNLLQTRKGAAYMVVPKRHVVSLRELALVEVFSIFFTLFRVYRKIKKNSPNAQLNLLYNEGEYAGQTVEHIHIHIFVREEGDGMSNMSRPTRHKIELEEINNYLKWVL